MTVWVLELDEHERRAVAVFASADAGKAAHPDDGWMQDPGDPEWHNGRSYERWAMLTPFEVQGAEPSGLTRI